jgi:hypothetical protein
MHRADAVPNRGEASRRLEAEENPADCYQGVELAPHTLESLVTWDVSGHAQHEQRRLDAAYRAGEVVEGG